MSSNGNEKSKTRNKHSPSLVSRLALAYYCATFGGFTWIWVTIIRIGLVYPLVVWPLVFLYLYVVARVSRQEPLYTGSWKPRLRHWGMWRACAAYFQNAELINGNAAASDGDDSSENPCLFVYHPHGVLAFGAWLAFGTEALGFSKIFHWIKDCRIVTLNINFWAPILREYLLLHGVCSCSKKAITTLLELGKSVVLVVGGGSESLLSAPNEYNLVLNRRKGFVKIALKTGARLVPVIGFGEPDTYWSVNQFGHDNIIRKCQRMIEKRLGFTIPIVVGRGVFLPLGLLPNPVKIVVVTGKPIRVEKYVGDDHESAEFRALVDKYHGMYKKALIELFETHKERYTASEECHLNFVE
jgi:hypothetical protein